MFSLPIVGAHQRAGVYFLGHELQAPRSLAAAAANVTRWIAGAPLHVAVSTDGDLLIGPHSKGQPPGRSEAGSVSPSERGANDVRA